MSAASVIVDMLERAAARERLDLEALRANPAFADRSGVLVVFAREQGVLAIERAARDAFWLLSSEERTALERLRVIDATRAASAQVSR